MKANKFLSTFILSLVFIVAAATKCAADAAARTYLHSKLRFYYVANPNTDTTRTLLTLNTNATDERNLFGGNAAMDPMKKFLKAMFNDASHGGDESFQFAVKEILRIRDKLIAVFLYNDAQPFNNFAKNTFINCVDGSNYQWPCATNSGGGGFSGRIHLGQHFFKNESADEAKWTILHELVHTQDMSDFPQHGFLIGGKWYHYGADESHMYHEAIPSMGFAFMEGIANAFAYQFQGGKISGPKIDTWFSPNRQIVVEMAAPATGGSNDVRLYKQLQDAGVKPLKTADGYAHYKLSQLPPRILIHNEMVIANILYQYMNHISFKRVIKAFKTYNTGSKSVFSGNGTLETMMTTLCQAGLPESMQAQSFPSCADFPDRKEYLLPLAYADYFTTFSATSEAAFNQLFDNGMNGQLISCYWALRDKVKDSCKSAKNFSGAATDIAIALGINSSQPED